MKLYAISDLHVGAAENREAVEELSPHPEDWLIIAGDVGETGEDLDFTLRTLTPRFRQLIWVPGNHELWTLPRSHLRGEAKYRQLVSVCQSYGVLTPEDPYPRWPGEGPPRIIAPLFLLYDYSFRPDEVREEDAVQWAADSGVMCTDEAVLFPDPYPSRSAWCAARCEQARERLEAIPAEYSTILVNHFPLRRHHARLPRIPRFSIWCGTRRTEDWHQRFRAEVVVTGHLHIPLTFWDDGVRFEEVSLGYPRQWKHRRGIDQALRQILPATTAPSPSPIFRG
ncbi:MAG: metallophosphoesterase family protein [Hyalangium sp.]|uniref:metallophosphoesterase family protein n=1 Tax=Hyalangium sp. TaxID=2028555 RepID=UPI00389A151C